MVTSEMVSPNGGCVSERYRLGQRFEQRLSVNTDYTRKTVSYQGNRSVPGFRWMKYKEGFSHELVSRLLDEYQPKAILDPFAGMGTTPLVAAGKDIDATGIEIMPVGVLAGTGIVHAANGLSEARLHGAAQTFLERVRSQRVAQPGFHFPHVAITQQAFPEQTECALAKGREFLAEVTDPAVHSLLNLACLSVLEDVSYTRKDGQYLRWDQRSGRTRAKVHKGRVLSFQEALSGRLTEMVEDIDAVKALYGGGRPTLVTGSCLEVLREMPAGRFDMVITSPPYVNRYDYTRTYALELAWLGFDQQEFSDLRQRMLSATVENKAKATWLDEVYGRENTTLARAQQMYREQHALQEVLSILRAHVDALSNRHVIRMLEGYFFEMAVVIAELGRVVKPGGTVIMVNDNVQYHGEEVPVDFILSDFAEHSGFACMDIWTLPRGKGNSSQQMARFGRREIRKCVYKWVRTDG